MSELVKGVKQE